MASRHPGGRPRKVDDDLIRKLRRAGIPAVKIAQWLEVTRGTVYVSERRAAGASRLNFEGLVRACAAAGCGPCGDALQEGST